MKKSLADCGDLPFSRVSVNGYPPWRYHLLNYFDSIVCYFWSLYILLSTGVAGKFLFLNGLGCIKERSPGDSPGLSSIVSIIERRVKLIRQVRKEKISFVMCRLHGFWRLWGLDMRFCWRILEKK